MATPSEPLTARAQQHLAMLAELADLTMALCKAASARAAEQLAAPTDLHNAHGAVRDFTRLAASVRQTIALEARIAAGPLLPAVSPTAAPRNDQRTDQRTDQRDPPATPPRDRTAFTPERSDTAHLDRLDPNDPAIAGIIENLHIRLGATPGASNKPTHPPAAATKPPKPKKTVRRRPTKPPGTPRQSPPSRQAASRKPAAEPPGHPTRRQRAAKL